MSEPGEGPEPQEHGPVKSFLEHLEDLRWVLLKILVSVAAGWLLCFSFAPAILLFLEYPLKLSGIEDPTKFLRVFSPMEAFSISFQLALYAGLLLVAPLVIYFLVAYILPALTRRERRLIMPVFWLGSLFFFAGAAFCYFLVLPPTLRVSREFARWLNLSVEFWTVNSYVSFVTQFMLGMGAAFELPLAILLLVRFGVLDHAKLAKVRSYVIVGNFIVAAALTPGPDMVSQFLLAVPMTLMYEACIWIAWFMERKKRSAPANDNVNNTLSG